MDKYRISSLITRLKYFNNWRRGAEAEPPDPLEIGMDIDSAIILLEQINGEQASYKMEEL